MIDRTADRPARRRPVRPLAVLAWTVLATALVLATGCGPSYPNCENDDHCKSKGEYCLDGKCAQCRVDSQCPGAGTDVCVTCVKGACGRKPDCCTTKLDCGTGKRCEANKCVAECAADADCGPGKKCQAGACVGEAALGAGCKSDTDCGSGLRCEGGKCVDSEGKCTVQPIYFDFNEYTLTSGAQDRIGANYKCLKEQNMSSLVLEGHTDERGTDAYNMELGNRRAKAVKQYLQTVAPKLKVKTLSYGKTKPTCSDESESCWQNNRRVELRGK